MSETPPHPSARIAVILCDLAMMALAIAVNLLPVFLTTLAHDLQGGAGLTGEQLGRIFAVTFAGLVSGIALAGPLADRLGGRIFAVAGNVLIAIGLAVLGIAPGYHTVLLASFIMGLGAGTLDMILSPIVSALQPDRRTVAMNLLHSFYCFGAVATILIGSLALRFNVPWRTLSLGLVPMPLCIALGFCFIWLPPLVEKGSVRIPLRTLLSKPFVQVGLIAIFLGGSTELGMADWLPAYAEKTLHFSQWTAGMGFLGFSVAMALGRAGVGFLPKSIGPIRLMVACCSVSIVLFLTASFSPIDSIALISCILAGFAASCLWPSTLAVVADEYSNGGASLFAILAAMGNFGGIFMPWAVGAVADRSSLRLGLASAALCPLLMIPVLLWMGARYRKIKVAPASEFDLAMPPPL